MTNVIIYESPTVQPRAWMVYDVRAEDDGAGLDLLASGDVDGGEVAFVEGDVPTSSAPADWRSAAGDGHRLVAGQHDA